MRWMSTGLSVLLLSVTGVVEAQTDGAAKTQVTPIPVVQPGAWGGSGNGWGGWNTGGGSTAFGSATTGMSHLVQAQGQANLANSAAAINYQQARRSAMENNMMGAEAYFQVREMNRQAREAERAPRATQADLVRYAKEGVPKRMSPSELDPLTGAVNWPVILRDDVYQEGRKTVELAFTTRAQVGHLTADQRAALTQAIESLQATLKQNLPNYSPQDYVRAKKFLEQLAYERQLAPS